MPFSIDVTLPKLVEPKFPAMCVVCLDEPDSTTKVVKNSQNWVASFFMPILLVFGWSRTELPICRSCKPRFYFQRWGRTTVCWGILIAAVMFAWPYFENWNPLTRKLVVLGVAILAAAPYLALEVFWPRCFDMTAQGGKVTYEFRSAYYALEFYQVNRRYVLSSDFGHLEDDEFPSDAEEDPWSVNGT